MTRLWIPQSKSSRTTPGGSAPKPRLSENRALTGAAVLALTGLTGAGTVTAESGQPSDAGVSAQAPQPSHATPRPASQPGNGAHRVAASRYHPDRFAGRAGTYYRLIWGVDDLAVKWGESGEVIRFSYRVLDAAKAKVLNDHKNEPSLIDPRAGVKLVVPSMENVGQLRQTAAPEDGKAYWIVFSNRGRLVKRGDHVNVVIGSFHADGLVVD
jgi:hypothetical protein